MTTDPKPIAEVYNFIEEVLKRYSKGKVDFDYLNRCEMMELGYNPNDPESVAEYEKFMEDIAESIDKLQQIAENFSEPDVPDDYFDIEFEPDFDLTEDDDE